MGLPSVGYTSSMSKYSDDGPFFGVLHVALGIDLEGLNNNEVAPGISYQPEAWTSCTGCLLRKCMGHL